MSEVKFTVGDAARQALAGAVERKPVRKVLRTRAIGKKVDYDALLKRVMRRYPKTMERLAAK